MAEDFGPNSCTKVLVRLEAFLFSQPEKVWCLQAWDVRAREQQQHDAAPEARACRSR